MAASITFKAGLAPQHKAWAEAALADGWEPDPKWGDRPRPESDRSVFLRKVLPDGDVLVVWLVDRDSPFLTHEDCVHGRGRFGNVSRCKESTRRDVSTSAWAANGQAAFDLPPVYDAAAIEAAIGTCHTCKRVVGTAYLRPLGFAGRICVACDADGSVRSRVEFPGWCN